jgi:hypothetical protein
MVKKKNRTRWLLYYLQTREREREREIEPIIAVWA